MRCGGRNILIRGDQERQSLVVGPVLWMFQISWGTSHVDIQSLIYPEWYMIKNVRSLYLSKEHEHSPEKPGYRRDER